MEIVQSCPRKLSRYMNFHDKLGMTFKLPGKLNPRQTLRPLILSTARGGNEPGNVLRMRSFSSMAVGKDARRRILPMTKHVAVRPISQDRLRHRIRSASQERPASVNFTRKALLIILISTYLTTCVDPVKDLSYYDHLKEESKGHLREPL